MRRREAADRASQGLAFDRVDSVIFAVCGGKPPPQAGADLQIRRDAARIRQPEAQQPGRSIPPVLFARPAVLWTARAAASRRRRLAALALRRLRPVGR